MRNIAFLEWGPVLRYVASRDQILIRGWYNDGPMLPKFLQPGAPVIRVRYALCTHANLDKVIGNLRRCFGFPYSDSIGFWNALTRKGRVRRENSHILEKLSVWSIATNMDAVVWVDYEKTTAIKGGLGFTLRSYSPKPFSKSQFKILAVADDDDEEQRAARTRVTRNEIEVHDEEIQPEEPPLVPERPVEPASPRSGSVLRLRRGGLEEEPSLEQKRTGPMDPRIQRYFKGADFNKTIIPGPLRSTLGAVPEKKKKSFTNFLSTVGPSWKKNEISLQEEFVPVIGSIYQRSLVPGPGHYHLDLNTLRKKKFTFGGKKPSKFETDLKETKENPGPGQYNVSDSTLEHYCAVFPTTKRVSDTNPIHLPYISDLHSRQDLQNYYGSQIIYDPPPPPRTPRYTIPKARKN